jgi:predicted RNA-binding protein with PIN domain
MILGRGAARLSSRELWLELQSEKHSQRSKHVTQQPTGRTPLSNALSEEQRQALEAIRRQK